MNKQDFMQKVWATMPELAAEISHLSLDHGRVVLNKATGLELSHDHDAADGLDAYWRVIESQGKQ